MMNKPSTDYFLLLDIGNTRTKWSLAPSHLDPSSIDLDQVSGALAHHQDHQPIDLLKQTIDSSLAISGIACVCVASPETAQHWKLACQNLWPLAPWHEFKSSSQTLDLTNSYDHPESLGADRWAAVLGAASLLKHRDLLIVNAGTATTLDYLSALGQYEGGWIIPGLDLMLGSLASGTAKLPDLRQELAQNDHNSFGKTTKSCIYEGCIQSQLGAIMMALDHTPMDTQVMISGGNMEILYQAFLTKHHQSQRVSQDKHIVLRGLYAWLNSMAQQI